jgi:isocitrate lyase
MLNASMFELAHGYAREGMASFVRLQEREFQMEREIGFRAIKHQSFVGAGYFDQVQITVTGGEVSTSAMKGSTEEHQFNPSPEDQISRQKWDGR